LYLLDTNIVSADAPTKHAIGPNALAAWIHRNSERLFISTIIIAEIEAGVARAVRIGATTKGERLLRWLAAINSPSAPSNPSVCLVWPPECMNAAGTAEI